MIRKGGNGKGATKWTPPFQTKTIVAQELQISPRGLIQFTAMVCPLL